ncbi:MAG TPA: hypothetical protein VHR41_04475 [Gemmatimonadales bacterium]|nr:hypothetical protein [Gemmatimonadales bacterium]
MVKDYRSPRSASTRRAVLVALPLLAAPLRAQQPDIEAHLHGLVLMNAFYTSNAVNNSDVPQFVIPAAASSRTSATSAAVRQSRVTLTALVPEFGRGALSGILDLDFFGGQQPSSGGRTFPLLRIRRAFAELTWRRAALLIGQESPPIAAVSPSSLASIGFPDFAGAGNLWLWIPQIRLSGDLAPAGGVRVGAEVAVLAPTSGEAQGPFFTQPDIAERSGRPYFQGRLRARWGAEDQQGELSVGGHYGWLVDSSGGRVPSRALVASVWTPLTTWAELRAEAFVGQALAGLGGGGIGQSMVLDGVPVHTSGGWAQLNLRPTPAWEVGGGGGIDDPDDDDLALGSRRRNVGVEGHVHWRHAPAVIGLEVRGLWTRYAPAVGRLSAAHVNLAAGFEF